jgi:hypothetical protein
VRFADAGLKRREKKEKQRVDKENYERKKTRGIKEKEKQEIKRTYVKQHIQTMITVDDPRFQNSKLPRPQQNRENASLNSATSVCPYYVTTFTRPN